MKIQLETEINTFEKLKDEWNDLVDRMDFPEIFYRWEWAWLCYKHVRRGADLFILTIKEGNKLIALAPFCIVRRRILGITVKVVENIVTGTADYRNVLVAGTEHRRRVVRGLLEWFTRHRSSWDILDLSGLSSRDSTTLHLTTVTAEFSDLRAVPRIVARTPSLRYEKSASQGDKKQLHWLRNRAGKLEQEGFKIEIGAELTRELWAKYCDLHRARWPRGPFHDPRCVAFYEELTGCASEDRGIEFSHMSFGGQPVAMHFGFRDRKKIYFYMPIMDQAFKSYRVGAVLANEMVSRYSTTHSEFDFLRGDESYKYWWTDEVDVNFQILIFFRSNMRALAYNFKYAVHDFTTAAALPGLVLSRGRGILARVRGPRRIARD